MGNQLNAMIAHQNKRMRGGMTTGKKITIAEMQDRSCQARKIPMTLPKLKFMEGAEDGDVNRVD